MLLFASIPPHKIALMRVNHTVEFLCPIRMRQSQIALSCKLSSNINASKCSENGTGIREASAFQSDVAAPHPFEAFTSHRSDITKSYIPAIGNFEK